MKKIRQIGGEFGATMGRYFLGGWICIKAKRAIQLNGLDALSITKLNVLDSLKSMYAHYECIWK